MGRFKRAFSLVFAVVMMFSLAACKGQSSSEESIESSSKLEDSSSQSEVSSSQAAEPTGYTVVDSKGQSVTFDTVPTKIISLIPSNTEILFALGLDEEIIGVSTWCNYPEQATSKKQYATGEKLNVEEIIAADPDVVFIGTMGQTIEQNNQLVDAGIKVVVTEAISFEETYKVIDIIGTAVGRKDKADEIVSSMKSKLTDLVEQVKSKKKVSVFFETSPLEYGLWSGGKGTFQNEILELIGAKNIFGDLEGWAEVSEEQIIEKNPDVIITISSEDYGKDGPVNEIKSRPNWSKISAVKNDRVYATDGDIISRPGPRLVDGAKAILLAVYGQ